MVIYFTGTGNSRYVAEAIADRLSDETVSSNTFIKKNEKGNFTSDKPWVFVFPVYLSTIAEIFANFIKESEFSGSNKAYFVATAASVMGATPNACAKLCKLKGLEYRGTALVQMPQNYLVFFKLTEKEEAERRIEASLFEADKIAKIVSENLLLEGEFVSGFEYFGTKLVEKMYNGPFTTTRKYRTTQECSGCGLCAKTCPLNKIEMVDGRPKWSGSCIHCMGCINVCPKRAIEYGKKTVGMDRYYCRKYIKK